MVNNTMCALQYERAPQNGDSHKSVFNRLCDYIIGYLIETLKLYFGILIIQERHWMSNNHVKKNTQ
jgi:hypothetical protein